MIYVAIAGAIWGALAILFLDLTEPVSTIVIVSMLIGLSTGAAITYASYPLAYWIFALMVKGTLLAVLVLSGLEAGLAASPVILVAFLA